MDQMTRSLAVALAPKGIRVNAVAFGSVMSASLQAALKDNPDYRDRSPQARRWAGSPPRPNWPRRCSSLPPTRRRS